MTKKMKKKLIESRLRGIKFWRREIVAIETRIVKEICGGKRIFERSSRPTIYSKSNMTRVVLHESCLVNYWRREDRVMQSTFVILVLGICVFCTCEYVLVQMDVPVAIFVEKLLACTLEYEPRLLRNWRLREWKSERVTIVIFLFV